MQTQHIRGALQCVAVCCSVLQAQELAAKGCFTATHCVSLQHTASHCNTLQHTATHCNTLQHTATHCVSFAVSIRLFCLCWSFLHVSFKLVSFISLSRSLLHVSVGLFYSSQLVSFARQREFFRNSRQKAVKSYWDKRDLLGQQKRRSETYKRDTVRHTKET